MVPYIGFKQTIVPFKCPPRFAGTRGYTLKQSLKLASNGIFSFSTAGLKIPLFFGVVVLIVTFAYFFGALLLVFMGKTHVVPGWMSLVALICLSIGLQLTSIGIFGLYIGNVYMEIKGRPLYFVQNKITFPAPENS
jgi:dolichol-phosphate mannosyltransferase